MEKVNFCLIYKRRLYIAFLFKFQPLCWLFNMGKSQKDNI